MIKCGSCGGRHGNVLEVRNCHGTQVADSARKAESGWAYLNGTQERRTTVAVLERPRTAITEAGMYRILVDDPDAEGGQTGRIFKVQLAVHGSGRFYAKELLPGSDDDGDWKFVYTPGAINLLFAEDRMTIEDAAKFGQIYGVCCRCGLTLTDEKSIKAGIGPICAKKI
jgi:hypothetical protein